MDKARCVFAVPMLLMGYSLLPVNTYFMHEKVEKLDKFLAEQGVSEDDRRYWQVLLSQNVPETAVDDLFTFLTSYPDEVGWMRSMVEKKAQAIRENDESALVVLVEEEAKYIEELQGK